MTAADSVDVAKAEAEEAVAAAAVRVGITETIRFWKSLLSLNLLCTRPSDNFHLPKACIQFR